MNFLISWYGRDDNVSNGCELIGNHSQTNILKGTELQCKQNILGKELSQSGHRAWLVVYFGSMWFFSAGVNNCLNDAKRLK